MHCLRGSAWAVRQIAIRRVFQKEILKNFCSVLCLNVRTLGPSGFKPEGLASHLPGSKAPVSNDEKRKGLKGRHNYLANLRISVSAFQALALQVQAEPGPTGTRQRMYQPFRLKFN